MQHLRRHSAFSLVSLLLLVGLAGPSLHSISHSAQQDRFLVQDDAHEPVEGLAGDPAVVLQIDTSCPTCDLISTLIAVSSCTCEQTGIAAGGVATPVGEQLLPVSLLSSVNARAPPAART